MYLYNSTYTFTQHTRGTTYYTHLIGRADTFQKCLVLFSCDVTTLIFVDGLHNVENQKKKLLFFIIIIFKINIV